MRGIARRVTRSGMLALAFSVVGTARAEAQADFLGPGAGFIAAGASGIATRELDDWLAERGYPTFGGTAVVIGLGGYRILSSGVMLGAEFNGLIVGEEPHEGREVGLGGGYATLGAGYMVNLSPRARIYPRVGVGVGGMGLWVKKPGQRGFRGRAGRVRSRARDRLNRAGMVVDLGAGAELLPGGRRGPLIGLRAGYLALPFNPDWVTSYGHPVRGSPEASIAGLYVRVTVGWAWRR